MKKLIFLTIISLFINFNSFCMEHKGKNKRDREQSFGVNDNQNLITSESKKFDKSCIENIVKILENNKFSFAEMLTEIRKITNDLSKIYDEPFLVIKEKMNLDLVSTFSTFMYNQNDQSKINFIQTLRNSLTNYQALLDDGISIDLIKSLEKEKRADPPFIKIITPDKKIIYVLGSIHNTHPKALMVDSVYKIVKEITKTSTLFIENTSSNKSTIKSELQTRNTLDHMKHEEKKININWKLSDIEFDETDSLWLELKDENIPRFENIKLRDIITFPCSDIIVYLYTNSYNNISKLRFKDILGLSVKDSPLFFEATIRKLYGKHPLALETIEEVNSAVGKDKLKLRSYLTQSLKKLKNTHDKMQTIDDEQINLITKYQNSINFYDIEKLKTEMTSVSIIERNKNWVDPVIRHLATSQKPLLIVCGLNHLIGKDSFINLLNNKLNSDMSKSDAESNAIQTTVMLEHLNNSGQWVPYNLS